MWTSTRAAAEELDRADRLSPPGPAHGEPIRLDGSSGGPRSRSTPARLRDFVENRWDLRGPRPHLEDDRERQARLAGAAIAHVIGADPAGVSVGESASMNLFNGLLTAAGLRPERPDLVIGRSCFAEDEYLARSAADFAGRRLRLVDDVAELPEVLDERAAVLALSHVDLISGAVRDGRALTELAHRHGALALWDLSHSAGAVRVDLRDWDADFAIGCGHRYLGGGTGAPGFCYLSEHLRRELLEPPARAFPGVPSALAVAELRAGLSALTPVPAAELEEKSTGLAEFFLRCLAEAPGADPAPVPDEHRRGPSVCLAHKHAHYVAQALLGRGVVVDVVEPDRVRFNFAPLWLRYADVRTAAEHTREVLHDLG